MAAPRVVHRQEFVVALDYGQFYLHTADNDPDLAVTLLEQAQDADGIAQTEGLLVIESPHQNNFEMPLSVEVWDRRPADDLDHWQEAFEADLDVTDTLVYESPTMDLTAIDVPPGRYHALIAGRSFVAHGWPGSTEPGDEWRIRLWPSTRRETARRLRAFSDPDHETVVDDDAAVRAQRGEQARLAALRVRADLEQAPSARALSGQLSAAIIDTVVPGKIARFWFLAAHLDVTNMGGGSAPRIGGTFTMSTYDEDEDPIVGTDGEIRCEWTELDDPARVAMSWRWLGPKNDARLSRPSTLHVQFVEATTAADHPATRIHLEHSHTPIEWTENLTDFWTSKIDMWVWQAGHGPNWRGTGR